MCIHAYPVVHYSARISCRYAIHRCHACHIVHDWLVSVSELGLHYGFVLRVRPWFTLVVTHVLPYPFSALLSDTCPVVVQSVMASNLTRLERAKNLVDSFVVTLHRNPGGPRQNVLPL